MPDRRTKLVEDIFFEALDCPVDERDRFLRDRCGGDHALREEVTALLQHEREAAPGFLSGGADDAEMQVLGERIGGFTVRRLIASGGMGAVYEAEQDHPQRTVALKVMRRGVASRGSMRRFRYEAQLLARLRHPAIAQVYDAGTYRDSGAELPYFAMELIPSATAVTEYAEDHNLSTRERLELFLRICDAVEHGHQKGIIHRDLKPSNILVDPSGQPKVIDFGVARSTDSDIAVTTMRTSVGQLVGTLQYMSPEQCEADPDDLDTRSDIYSLGVVLYELLCGRLPYDVTKVHALEATRIIRERAPARPSSIDRTLRGDLETILFKALEKDRDRRYQSAAELASDIRRHMNHEPIAAHPPSVAYQLHTFARRNRPIVAAAVGVFLVLIVGIITTTVGFVQAAKRSAEAAREAAKTNAINEFLMGMLDTQRAERLLESELQSPWGFGSDTTVAELLDGAEPAIAAKFANQPELEAAVRLYFAAGYWYVGRHVESEAQATRALAIYESILEPDDDRTLEATQTLAESRRMQGRPGAAEPLFWNVFEARRKKYGERDPRTIQARSYIVFAGRVGRLRGREDFEQFANETVDLQNEVFGSQSFASRLTRSFVSEALLNSRELERAELMATRVIDDGQAVNNADSFPTYQAMMVLGSVAESRGDFDEALRYYRAAVDGITALHGRESPFAAEALLRLGRLLNAVDRFAEAEPFLRLEVKTVRRAQGDDGPGVPFGLHALAWSVLQQRKFDEARDLYRELIDLSWRLFGDDDGRTLSAVSRLVWASLDNLETVEAESLARRAVEGFRAKPNPNVRNLVDALGALAVTLERAGKDDESVAIRREAVDLGRDEDGMAPSLTLRSLNNLAWSMWQRGQGADAEPFARSAVEEHRRRLEQPSLLMLVTMDTLGAILRDVGKFEESAALYEEMFAIDDEIELLNPTDRADCEVRYGECLVLLRRLDEAEAILVRALETLERRVGSSDPRAVSASDALQSCLDAANP